MRKEVIYALVAGLFLGIIIAFGVWRANNAFKSKGVGAPETSLSQASPQPSGLTVAKPDNLSVFSQNPVTILGISAPENWIVISGKDKDLILKTKSDGSFAQELTLLGGINQFLLTALNQTGTTLNQTLTLIFSTEFSKPESTPVATEAGITEESEIREKVIKKVQKVLDNPKASLGTVTDILTNNLQIKTETGEIKQISANPDTPVIKTGTTSKTVKFSDIAIGDFIVAMGYQNDSQILEARRILITNPPDRITVTPILGTVTKVEKKSVFLNTNGNRDIILNFPSKWQGPEIKQIKEGDQLIAVGKLSENTLEIRTIFIIPSPTPTPKI